MTVPIAVLVGLGAVIAAALALIGTLLGHQAARIAALEQRLDATDEWTNRLWTYLRGLIDLYFRHRQDGAPDPPPIPVRNSD